MSASCRDKPHRKRQAAAAGAAIVSALMIATADSPGRAQPLAREAESASQPKLIARVDDFPDWVTSVAVSPDGQLIAAGSFESARIVDPNGKVRTEWKPGAGFVRALAFSPDGQTLLTGGYKEIRIWNVSPDDEGKPAEAGTLSGHRGYVEDLVFSADSSRVASCGEDATVRVWDWRQTTELLRIDGDGTPIQSVAFSPNGRFLATAAGDETRLSQRGRVTLWNAESGEKVLDFPEHGSAATSVCFSADGDFLLSGSFDERVHVADAATGESRGYFGAHSRPVNAIALVGEDRVAVSGSGGRFREKNEVKFWEPVDGTTWASIEPHAGKINDLAVSADGRLLATASDDKTVALIDVSPVLTAAGISLVGAETEPEAILRVGIIGLDTSHVIGFTKLLNQEDAPPELTGCRVVAAYPQGSLDIESSVSRVPKYTEDIQTFGVEIVDSIPALLDQVDVVLLETNDGRPHLQQVLPVLKAGKPVFVDKPIAGSLTDAFAIIKAAEHYDVPLFSSSVMRFYTDPQEVRAGAIGEITGCDTFSPCSLEPSHPDLFWYGIHGVEALFTVMGPECRAVSRVSTDDFEVVVGQWEGGRIGTFRGIRRGKGGFGGTAFGMQGTRTLVRTGGYDPLVAAIVAFFKTGQSPVPHDETLAIYAFMEAADESKRQGGAAVRLEDVLAEAGAAADEKLASLLKD